MNALKRKNFGSAAHPGSRRNQRGAGFLGFLIILALLGVVFLIAAKVFPTYVEYRAITSAVKKAQSSSTSESEIRRAFDRSAVIDEINSISGKDLQITKDAANNYLVSFGYTKKIELVNPVSLLIDYTGDSKGP